MARKSTEVIPKKRGRPATGKDPLVAVRLPPKMITALDKWAAREGLTRSAAVRQMIERGLER
jgi:predicted DNA-binding protein